MKFNRLSLITCLAIIPCLQACSDDNTLIGEVGCTSSEMCPTGKVCKNGNCVKDNTNKDPNTDPNTDPNDPNGQHDPSKPSPEDYPDADGDTIADIFDKCEEDTDNDTIPNCQDEDSDNDTIPDKIEAGNDGDVTQEPLDSNGDGIPNFLSPDSDGNGIPDSLEVGPDPLHPVDTDNDDNPDYASMDNDGDGLFDVIEIQGLSTTDLDGTYHLGRKCGETWCEPGSVNSPWDSDNDTIPDYMDADSDNDTIPDKIEGVIDTDYDGILDIYDLDSDNDTIPDSQEVDSNGVPLAYTSESGTFYCFQVADCDGDALFDTQEISCSGMNGINNPDQDNDGFPDGAEYVAAQYAMTHGTLDGSTVSSLEDLICNPNLGVKNVFEFFFELPWAGPQKTDTLVFEPSVKKLDLVFNVDTTSSMTNAINNVKSNIGSVIQKIRSMVPDSGIGLTNFDDFPIGDCHIYPYPITLEYSDPYGNVVASYSNIVPWAPCGLDFSKFQFFSPTYGVINISGTSGMVGDLPFRLLGTVSTDAGTITSYTQNPLFTTRHGADGAESGAESLYQIATGAGISWNAGQNSAPYYPEILSGQPYDMSVSWQSGSIAPHTNAPGTWGGVDFRNDTLPVVIHTTDVYSHDKADGHYLTSFPSAFTYTNTVNNPHYSSDLIPVLKQKGIRVITLNVRSQEPEYGADELGQMTLWSRESNAVVPACAFDCNGNCCLGDEIIPPSTINGQPNQCVLAYKANMSDVSDTVVNGVDALIKYGTYTVATRLRGEPIPGSSVDTSCFIKQVAATEYVAPPMEPEHSCNPTALPTEVANAGYNNGFENFAPGTSSADVKGAELHYTVIAQNDNCVEPTDVAQVFTAYIDVYDPTTGVSFGERKVSIIVPPGIVNEVN